MHWNTETTFMLLTEVIEHVVISKCIMCGRVLMLVYCAHILAPSVISTRFPLISFYLSIVYSIFPVLFQFSSSSSDILFRLLFCVVSLPSPLAKNPICSILSQHTMSRVWAASFKSVRIFILYISCSNAFCCFVKLLYEQRRCIKVSMHTMFEILHILFHCNLFKFLFSIRVI